MIRRVIAAAALGAAVLAAAPAVPASAQCELDCVMAHLVRGCVAVGDDVICFDWDPS